MAAEKSALPGALRGLCCPCCRGALSLSSDGAVCLDCERRYAARGGRPALLDPAGPLAGSARETAAVHEAGGGWASRLARRLPRLTGNPRSARNFEGFVAAARTLSDRPRLLAMGCGEGGEGMAAALKDPGLEWLESDIRWTSRTALLADIHQIPFEDGSFDGVVLQAVLEHVLDPVRAVAEVHRVLRPGGVVYAETPFLQHVHAGAHDFTRFTHLGHRRLFRQFEEIESGPASGPGSALAWAWQGFVLSWARTRRGRLAATLAARLSGFWLKHLDGWLLARPGAYDFASAYYFLGAKAESALPDEALLRGYRGLQR